MEPRIRDAGPEDRDAVARLHWEVRLEAFADSVPAGVLARKDLPYRLRYWEEFLADPRYGRERCALVLEEGGALLGIGAAGPSGEGELPGWPWILHHLYLRPAAQGRGLGRRLFAECAARLAAAGADRFHLWTPSGNGRARGFYEHLGGRLLEERVREDPEGTVRRVAYGWTLR
ncbi:MAG: GNAT family N-acetyltransferase [Planctomycetes bacterium]|nr:GNAT family N-acetyltransferase [Planctomycetota bacterium]